MQLVEEPELSEVIKMKQSRCIVVESVPLYLYNVEDYGQVELLFSKENGRPSIYDCDNFSDCIDDALKRIEYNPEHDYIVIVGGLIQIASLCAVVGNSYGCTFKALLFDARVKKYIEGMLG